MVLFAVHFEVTIEGEINLGIAKLASSLNCDLT